MAGCWTIISRQVNYVDRLCTCTIGTVCSAQPEQKQGAPKKPGLQSAFPSHQPSLILREGHEWSAQRNEPNNLLNRANISQDVNAQWNSSMGLPGHSCTGKWPSPGPTHPNVNGTGKGITGCWRVDATDINSCIVMPSKFTFY